MTPLQWIHLRTCIVHPRVPSKGREFQCVNADTVWVGHGDLGHEAGILVHHGPIDERDSPVPRYDDARAGWTWPV
jgi:hypothetical protein